jgi:hypothetical protein|uniref:Uncharacterized protein n=1 Tax=viral metagenome TaxID=1070528 RepID=A0A6C0BT17_9ZZZZ
MSHYEESTKPPHVCITSTKVPENEGINDNETDIGIIEIKPGMYGVTNPKKLKSYLSSIFIDNK